MRMAIAIKIKRLSNIDNWSLQDVSKWLKSKSMDKFVSVFLEQEIDGNTLLKVPIDSLMARLLKYDDLTMGSVIQVTDAIVQLSIVIEYNEICFLVCFEALWMNNCIDECVW